MMLTPPPSRVMRLRELAEYLRVHPSTIHRMLARGEITGFKVGSDWRFNIEKIDEWRMAQTGEVKK